METQEIRIGYGVLSPPLKEQIKKYGLDFDENTIASYEDCRDAIHILMFSDLLTDSIKDKLSMKLHKKIMAHLAKKNKKKVVKQ